MNTVKSLILGSAAGLIAMSGAQAADLPVKAKAVEYVRICSLYGAGFFYIPGTDTCIKLGGYLRVDTTFNGSIYDQPAWSGNLGAHDRFADRFTSRSRMALTVDTRTATEYGVVRTFGQGDFQFSTYGGSTVNPTALATAGASGTLTNDTPGGGYVGAEFLFIQFAGFTFGKSVSAYSVPWNGYGGNNNTSYLLGGPDYVTGVNNIQYTAQFGNGVSATIGLDEGRVFNRTSLGNVSTGAVANTPAAAVAGAASAAAGVAIGNVIIATPSGFGVTPLGSAGNSYGGQLAPDITGNIKVDQAWGIFTIAGVAHMVNASYYDIAANPGELSGHPDSKWGGAITAGLQLKNLPTGAGDLFNIDATYAKGDTKAVISTSATSPSFAMFGNAVNANSYQSVGLGYTSDGVFSGNNYLTNGTPIQLTESYGIRAGFIHNWSPYWQSSLFGSYSAVRYNQTAANLLATGFGATNARVNFTTGNPVPANSGNRLTAGSVYDPNFNVAMVGVRTGWTPVTNLTFSAEVLYFYLDQKSTGSFTNTNSTTGGLSTSLAKPAATYDFKDQSTVSFNVRAQRNF